MDWEHNEAFYLNELLPKLKRALEQASSQEKLILTKIRNNATDDVWNHLEELARWIKSGKSLPPDQLEQFNHLLDSGNYHRAMQFIQNLKIWTERHLYSLRLDAHKSRKLQEAFNLLNSSEFKSAKSMLRQIEALLNNEDKKLWTEKWVLAEQEFFRIGLEKVKSALMEYDFVAAEDLYGRVEGLCSRAEYDQLVAQAKSRKAQEERDCYVQSIRERINALLGIYQFDKARKLRLLIASEYTEEKYLQLEKEHRVQQQKQTNLLSLKKLLGEYKFEQADELFLTGNWLTPEEYTQMKAGHIGEYINQTYPEGVDDEQAYALAVNTDNLLITARAGSGKTRVLAAKTSLLIDHYDIHPDHIMVLAFNRKAAEEIHTRIKNAFNQPHFANARTFHSLAHQLTQPTEEILHDERDDISTQKQSLFVQDIVKEKLKESNFAARVYCYFRDEYMQMERSGFFKDDQEYYQFRRNLRWVTLNGERVKSAGEKMIADYFFEHDVPYIYEDARYWNQSIYRPDFLIFNNNRKFALEHWGIDPKDPKRGISSEWGKTWQEYFTQIDQKRLYWQKEGFPLLETCVKDLDKGRQAFEKILESRLVTTGIEPRRLTQGEILKRLREREYVISRLTKSFLSFIQNAKKRRWNPDNISEQIAKYQAKSKREQVFLLLAEEMFLIYEEKLRASHPKKIDFDDLLLRAISKVHHLKGECKFSVGNLKNRSIQMKELRWVLIDEYQDFSPLFFELIDALRQCNPRLKLVCVGDDWQAINSFAGSDLTFFLGYGNFFPSSRTVNLLTNHRSKRKIVETGNALMVGHGEPGKADPQFSDGQIIHYHIDDVWLEIRDDPQFRDERTYDRKFVILEEGAKNKSDEGTIRLLASKYLKLCYSLIVQEEHLGKTVAILNRTNWIEGVSLSNFRNRLMSIIDAEQRERIGNLEDKLQVVTAHKYKGKEADLVIILNACNGAFPLLHPDNQMFGIFGKDSAEVLEEERRLFYVALTRAESHLVIISEKENASLFLNALPAELRECKKKPAS